MKTYERFLKYVAVPTMSDENSESTPSTKKQLVLSKMLCEELVELGLSDATLDEYGYVYATLQKNTDEECNDIGFIAHVDTSDAASDENIKARLVKYDGEDILLNEEKKIYLSKKAYPYLDIYKGDTLVVTDGTTLLGADDKAGIAEIMTALEKIISSGAKHGKISVGFTPDEEIGRGADRFDVTKFGADYAYTVDGGRLGELEYENFNAASAKVTVHGISIHPGSAKGKMKNASLIACEFNSLLPAGETPSETSGYEGFYHLTSMEGEIELARLSYIIRDHSREIFEERKRTVALAAEKINKKYGDGTVELEIKDSYYNMREKIEPCMYVVDRARSAMLELGIEPIITPIRGGTDGARLSFMGLPCPNLATGCENAHSRFEFVSVESMEKITDLLVKICENAVTDGKK